VCGVCVCLCYLGTHDELRLRLRRVQHAHGVLGERQRHGARLELRDEFVKRGAGLAQDGVGPGGVALVHGEHDELELDVAAPCMMSVECVCVNCVCVEEEYVEEEE